MSKLRTVLYIIGSIIVVYIFLLAAWPVIDGIINDVAVQIAARPGIGQYVAPVQGVIYCEFVIFLIPAAVGMAVIVFVLKFDWGRR